MPNHKSYVHPSFNGYALTTAVHSRPQYPSTEKEEIRRLVSESQSQPGQGPAGPGEGGHQAAGERGGQAAEPGYRS